MTIEMQFICVAALALLIHGLLCLVRQRIYYHMLELFRVEFAHAEFLQLPREEREFFVTLAHATNDLRHVFYLSVAAERGTKSADREERKLAIHQLLFGVRLIYSILHEAWKVIERSWNGKGLGRTWHDRLDVKAKQGLSYLNKYFNAKDNLCRTIRDHFGFHYLPDHLQGPLDARWNRVDDFISGRRSANIFYSFAEEIRAVAMAQATLPPDAAKLWESAASEDDLRNAVIALYESWKPLHDAFRDFANCVLPLLVKSLPSEIRSFSAKNVTKFAEMKPVLFVEEPPD